MAAGILFGILGLGALCALIYHAAVYALPAFVGLTVGLWAFDRGAGTAGSIVAGVMAAAATLVTGRSIFGAARSVPVRAVMASVFAVPAAYAGYHVVLGLAHYGVASDGWRQTFATVGAAIIGFTAVARLTISVGPAHHDRGL